VVPIAAMAFFRGFGITHALVESVPIVTLAFIADRQWSTRRTRSVAASVGLMYCSALLVHLSGGVTEVHFHFFVMLGVISLYQDWPPFLLSIGFVATHHAVLGSLSPHDVYDHPEAWRSPLKWGAEGRPAAGHRGG